MQVWNLRYGQMKWVSGYMNRRRRKNDQAGKTPHKLNTDSGPTRSLNDTPVPGLLAHWRFGKLRTKLHNLVGQPATLRSARRRDVARVSFIGCHSSCRRYNYTMKVFGAYFIKKTSQVHNRKQWHRKVRILRRFTEDFPGRNFKLGRKWVRRAQENALNGNEVKPGSRSLGTLRQGIAVCRSGYLWHEECRRGRRRKGKWRTTRGRRRWWGTSWGI